MKAHETSVSREWEWLANFYTHTKICYVCMYVRVYVCLYTTCLAQAAGAAVARHGDLQTDNSWMPCKSMGLNSCRANAEWIVGGQKVAFVCVYDQYMYVYTYICT